VAALPAHQRPTFGELSRRSQVEGNPFRPGDAAARPPLQFAGEHAPAKAGRGAALRPAASPTRTLADLAAMPPVHGPGEDVATRRAIRAGRDARRTRPSSRDGHAGEAGFVAAPNLARLAAMPAVQFPGEGPHPDNHGKSAPTAPSYGEGRFFQTGRTLGSVVSRVCREPDGPLPAPDRDPPLVTATADGGRVVVAAASPAARARGIVPGVALTQARVLVPGLEVRPADPEGDRADLRALAERLARRWTPTVALSGEDGLLLDLTGVAHLHGGEAAMLTRLVRMLGRAGVAAHAAVADTAGAAWACARFGDAA
jgi:protein ImuB